MHWYHWHRIIVIPCTLITLMNGGNRPLGFLIYLIVFNNFLFLPVSWFIDYMVRGRKQKAAAVQQG